MSVNFKLLRSSTSDKRPTTAQLATGELGLNFADDSPGLFIKDDADGIVKIGPVEVGATAPNASPAGSSSNLTGEMWYDTGNASLKLYNGSGWVAANSSGGTIAEALHTISDDYAMAANSGGASFSNVEVANGVTVTVPQASDWQVINGVERHSIISETLKVINKDFLISHYSSGLSFDDVSIGGSATVTIPSTSTWRIL